jgi:hypothetical protein
VPEVNVADTVLVVEVNRLSGGIEYIIDKNENPERDEENKNKEIHRWRTKKTIKDVEERAEAENLRSENKRRVRSFARDTMIGLLCPRNRMVELQEIAEEQRVKSQEFSKKAEWSSVSFDLLFFDIIGNEEAVKGEIIAHVEELVADLVQAVESGNPKEMRDVAAKANNADALLAKKESEILANAIKAARKSARAITKLAKDQEVQVGELSTSDIEKALEPQKGFINIAQTMFVEGFEEEEIEELPMVDAPAVESVGE